MSLRQTIKSILESKVLRETSEPKKIGNSFIPDGVIEPIGIEEATEAILKAVRECVPEPWSPMGSEPELTKGWNACRQSILDKIGEGE